MCAIIRVHICSRFNIKVVFTTLCSICKVLCASVLGCVFICAMLCYHVRVCFFSSCCVCAIILVFVVCSMVCAVRVHLVLCVQFVLCVLHQVVRDIIVYVFSSWYLSMVRVCSLCSFQLRYVLQCVFVYHVVCVMYVVIISCAHY